jgi:hypothetical protein
MPLWWSVTWVLFLPIICFSLHIGCDLVENLDVVRSGSGEEVKCLDSRSTRSELAMFLSGRSCSTCHCFHKRPLRYQCTRTVRRCTHSRWAVLVIGWVYYHNWSQWNFPSYQQNSCYCGTYFLNSICTEYAVIWNRTVSTGNIVHIFSLHLFIW